MADNKRVASGDGANGHTHTHSHSHTTGQMDSNLRDFISQEFQNQRLSGQDNSSDVSDDRATQFLQRALNESQRMEAETSRSERRQQQLYQELGKERFEEWTKEHSEETLRDAARKADEEAMSVDR